jgi:hypothetical protein
MVSLRREQRGRLYKKKTENDYDDDGGDCGGGVDDDDDDDVDDDDDDDYVGFFVCFFNTFILTKIGHSRLVLNMYF